MKRAIKKVAVPKSSGKPERKVYPAELKLKVVRLCIKESVPGRVLAKQFSIYPTVLSRWVRV